MLPALSPTGSYLRPAVLWGLFKMLVRSYTGHYDYVIVNPVLATPRNKLYCHLLHHALWPPFDYTRHITSSYAQLLRQLGAKEVDTSYMPNLPPGAQTYAQQFLQQHTLQPGKFWLVNPVGSVKCKSLSDTQLKTILNILRQRRISAVLLDYKNQFTAFDKNAVRCTTNSILQTAAVLAQAAGVISVDTGIVHLADAYKKPMLVLYAYHYPATAQSRIFWASRQFTTRFLQGTNMVQDIPATQIEHILETEFFS